MPYPAAFQRIVSALAILAGVAGAPDAGAASARTSPPTRPAQSAAVTGAYKGAIVLDAATGRVLFEDNPDFAGPPASMTKLMTFAVLHDLVAAKRLSPEALVRVVAADTRMGGTQVWLKEHEEFPVAELIHAMMIQSANDAAYALARHAAGSVAAFVELMNAKARELGMDRTTFRTPHGLPPASRRIEEGDLTTPHDFALLCRHLVLNTRVLDYTAVRRRPFGPPQRVQPVDMVNHNNLLGKVDGVDGLKTGFTNAAGYCLSATAERNGRRVIVVTMGGATATSRDLKVAELLERGFAALPAGGVPIRPPASPAGAAAAIPIPLGPAAGPRTPAENAPPPIRLNLPARK